MTNKDIIIEFLKTVLNQKKVNVVDQSTPEEERYVINKCAIIKRNDHWQVEITYPEEPGACGFYFRKDLLSCLMTVVDTLLNINLEAATRKYKFMVG